MAVAHVWLLFPSTKQEPGTEDIEILVYPMVACKGTIADTSRPHFPRAPWCVRQDGWSF